MEKSDTLHCYEYPRPSVAVDLALFAEESETKHLLVLLIRRRNDPWQGRLALPGGFLEMDETTCQAASREAQEETGIASLPQLNFLGVYDQVDRDPRGRVISVAYYGMIEAPTDVKGGDDASEAGWYRAFDLKREDLAGDHYDIFSDGYSKILLDNN